MKFVTLREVLVRVEILRGIRDEREGFWIKQTCPAEGIDELSWTTNRDGDVPNEEYAAGSVLSFNDAKGIGITGRGCQVETLYLDEDRGLFIVTAKVQGAQQ